MMLNFTNETIGEEEIDYEGIATKVVENSLDFLGCPYEVELNLLLVEDDEMLEINSSQRNIATPTDVLSFPINEFSVPGEFVEEALDFNFETGELLLGDIVINLTKVKEQANEYGHSLVREYAFLIVHSILHLIGYDHMTADDDKEMTRLQEGILESQGITR